MPEDKFADAQKKHIQRVAEIAVMYGEMKVFEFWFEIGQQLPGVDYEDVDNIISEMVDNDLIESEALCYRQGAASQVTR